MKKYYINYINSIYDGLKNSLYFQDGKKLNAELFYDIVSKILKGLRKNQNKIFFFGNGASASFANHMALDFSKNGKILSRSLSDSSLLTALANDYSYEHAMTEFLKIEKVSSSDLVITISSSGNSSNITSVLNHCKENNIQSLALSGLKKDNLSLSLGKYSIYVPMKTYGMVECIHQVLLHLILDQSMNIFEWDRKEHQNMNAKYFKL